MRRITLYGATGFTGKLAAHQLWNEVQASPFQVRLAGRNREKLEELRRSLGSQAEREVEIAIADAQDRDALRRLTQDTHVLISTAGPYTLYGPLLVEACVQSGTHYLDITGETPFVRGLIDRHHVEARSRQIKVVPFCGFDSIPSDLGFWKMHQEWGLAFGQQAEPDLRITSLYQLRGGFNGGTLASGMELLRRGESAKVKGDPHLLVPDSSRLEFPPGGDWQGTRFIPECGLWGAPFFMAPINTRVVRRSQYLVSTGEVQSPSGVYTRSQYQEALGFRRRGQAVLTDWTQRIIESLPQQAAFVDLLQWLLPRPGSGPSEQIRCEGFTRATFLAQDQKGHSLLKRFRYVGDPGNTFTVMALVQSALILLTQEDAQRSQHEAYGVLTPATALGDALWSRLIAKGVSWE